MPTVKSEVEMTVPPIYSIEMDAAAFRDFNCHRWHIGVPTSLTCEKSSRDPIVVVIQHPHPRWPPRPAT
uniref:Uncharacterized protein n=1 Tax=Rhizophora mucronata TaxID=61149 RepID=A0A2P2QEB9_RHIMU